ncbi:MAG: tRNA 2-thiouridine(34) synthase MnmA, partial [Planctomycetota bacterium]
ESATTCAIDGADADNQPTSVSNPLLPIVQGRADHKQGCCSASDAEDARRVADHFGIPFYALDLQEDFRRIIDYFVDDYLNARTPNPCVQCNNWIKFGRLFDYAADIDAEYVATGHYARVDRGGAAPDASDTTAVPQLLRGVDGGKDQSYVLFGIDSTLLPKMLLPVGGFNKNEIRQMAIEMGLGVANKKDSQEICFVTQGHHSDFVKARAGADAPATSGNIVTTDGTIVGRHNGFEAFTVGQRKGLGVAMGEPYFVTEIDPATRNVVIGKPDKLLKNGLIAADTNWLIGSPPIGQRIKCAVQVRYNSPAKPATVWRTEEDELQVQFDVLEKGIAPGQAAVVYDGDRVLGGGWIRRAVN